MDWTIKDNFITSTEDLETGRKLRELPGKRIRFGIDYLDRATNGGFFLNDLIVVSARSGKGKTELTNIFAENIAKQGKRVLYYGLELAIGEGTMRMEYRALARILQENGVGDYISFQKFEANDLKQHEETFKSDIENNLSYLKNITWRHKDKTFFINDLKKELLEQKDNFDVCIVDHLSFIDNDDNYNENKNVEQTVKELKTFCDVFNKPVILVAHVRKSDRRAKNVMPHEEDIAGTKHIINIASRVILIAKDPRAIGTNGLYPTLFRLAKNRKADYTTYYIARINFNSITNSYEDSFDLLHCINEGEDYKDVEFNERPNWSNVSIGGKYDL